MQIVSLAEVCFTKSAGSETRTLEAGRPFLFSNGQLNQLSADPKAAEQLGNKVLKLSTAARDSSGSKTRYRWHHSPGRAPGATQACRAHDGHLSRRSPL